MYICGMLLLLKEPVPDGLLFGASGGTVLFGLVALMLALYAAFKKFVVLRKEDLEYEKNLDFQKNLKRRVSQLEDEMAAENNTNKESMDVAFGDKEEVIVSSNNAGTKVQPITSTTDVNEAFASIMMDDEISGDHHESNKLVLTNKNGAEAKSVVKIELTAMM